MSRTAFVVAVLGACVLAACGHHSNIRPLAAGAPAERYVGQFLTAEAQYPGGERGGSRAPVNGLELVLEREPGIPLIADGCHSVWLKGTQDRKRLLTIREADPGSGSSFGFAWSSDGQAAFIFGDHSGIDCSGPVRWENLRIIYTLADDVAGQVSKSAWPPNNAMQLTKGGWMRMEAL
jgi:hypothetical protein